MSVLVDVVNSVVSLEQTITNFFADDVFGLLTKFVAWFVQWSVVAMWKAKLAALAFSWGVAQQIMINLDISGHLNSTWAALDSRTMAMASFFRVPEAVSMLISASVTKFVFKFIGF